MSARRCSPRSPARRGSCSRDDPGRGAGPGTRIIRSRGHWAYDVEADGAGARRDSRSSRGRGPTRATSAAFDIVLPLVAWGYQSDPERWLALLDRLERERAPRRQPGAGAALEQRQGLSRGAWRERASRPSRHACVDALDEACARRGARATSGRELVIKPPISASAYGTFRLGPAIPFPTRSRGRRDDGPAVPALGRWTRANIR